MLSRTEDSSTTAGGSRMADGLPPSLWAPFFLISVYWYILHSSGIPTIPPQAILRSNCASRFLSSRHTEVFRDVEKKVVDFESNSARRECRGFLSAIWLV